MIQGMVPPHGQGFARGAGHPDLLLGDADKDDAFVLFESAQLLLQDLVFALAFLKTDQLQAFALDEHLDGFDEGLGHSHRLLGGGEAVSEVATTEGGDAPLAGELGGHRRSNTSGRCTPVPGRRVLSGVRRGCGLSSWRVPVGHLFSSNMEQPPLVGNIPAPSGAAPPNRAHESSGMTGAGLLTGPQTGKAARRATGSSRATEPCRSEALPR